MASKMEMKLERSLTSAKVERMVVPTETYLVESKAVARDDLMAVHSAASMDEM